MSRRVTTRWNTGLPGIRVWSAIITVTSGSSQIFAALAPATAGQSPSVGGTISPQATTSLAGTSSQVTVQAGKDPMIIGNSQTFSGTCTGCSGINLVLFGPGSYTNGVQLAQVNPDQIGSWRYTWNPGSSGTFRHLHSCSHGQATDKYCPDAVLGHRGRDRFGCIQQLFRVKWHYSHVFRTMHDRCPYCSTCALRPGPFFKRCRTGVSIRDGR